MLHTQKTGNEGGKPADRISGLEFCAWMDFLGFKTNDVVEALGVSRNTVTQYRAEGADKRVKHACRSIAHMMKMVEVSVSYPWEKPA